ncbi:DUF4249 domain-containing protein [Rufibacter soli]|jgi:hypothetical protein
MNLFLKYGKSTLFLLATLFLTACEEPYSPEVIDQPNKFLVVNGFINTNGPTVIKLSRSQNISETKNPALEKGAVVRVEEENGTKFTLQETQTGTYTLAKFQANPSKRYRLYIKTGNKEYASEYVAVKTTPPIENITWQADKDGLQFFVDTRDPLNNSRYYRWEFEETWEYTPYYYSQFEYKNGKMEARTIENDIYLCWREDKSNKIYIANSTKLSQDVISKFPLHKLHSGSDKIKNKYSILLKQFALSKEAYEYYEALQKNTENIGTLFDPLPTQLTGNITSLSDPAEPVIGFITAGAGSEKRIFVARKELPGDWRPYTAYCELDTIPLNKLGEYFSSPLYTPVSVVVSEQGGIIGYSGAASMCVDCRVYGTKTRPSYWQ